MAVKLGIAKPRAANSLKIISVEDGWQAFIDHCGRSAVLGGVSAETLKRYRAVRDKHSNFCRKHGIISWHDFDKNVLEKYGNWAGCNFADRTCYFELTLIKSVNGWLIQEKKLPADCKLVYSLSKPQGTDTYCYSREEVAAIIKHCRAAQDLDWLANVVIGLVHLGVRISELAGLRWTDVDMRTNIITVADERNNRHKKLAGTARTTKGKRSRKFPIHPGLRELLATLSQGSDGRVFHAARGGQLRPRNVLTAFIRDVLEPLKQAFPTSAGDIGFEHGRLHSFRHFFVSQAFLGGASEGEIREWVGHADSKMVEHYRHLGQKDSLRRMNQINLVDPDADEQERPGRI